MAAFAIGDFNGRAVAGQQNMVDINYLPLYRASNENSFEDFAYDMQLGIEETTGTMLFKILNDGGSVIYVEVWRLVTSRFSFWWFLFAVAQLGREVVGSWPQAVEKVVKRSVSRCMTWSEA